ncbi:MAG TPA: hypothetical protein VNJ08_08165 [Bacteriovoracaceae bacterium]|nr:hypothetical protein [Bacteriovoracaceae bacterium]
MTKKTFIAQQWLQRDADSFVDPIHPLALDHGTRASRDFTSRFPTFTFKRQAPQVHTPSDRFSPFHCFVPGWKGDSLTSKNVLKLDRLLDTVQSDIKNELFKTKDFPRSMKIGLYNEFLSYAESLSLHFEGLDDIASFWQMITPENLLEQKELSRFIDIYANRVATITFFKLRFISSLLDKCQIELTEKALLYPTSFLLQIFKNGSQSALNSRALETNLYSWYRPHEGMKESMRELLVLSRELAISEIIKHVSFRTQVTQDQQKVYSHALSHVSLGLFLNSLQVNFPMWLDTIEGKPLPPGGVDQEQIISCKFSGDYLESLSLSHWLAQENNKDFRWDEMLCPDFKGHEFISGTFTKICNELQFLTFLAHKSENQGSRPIEYICRIMGGHFRNRKSDQPKQGLLLDDKNPFYCSTYDRLVLNLCHFPKNNPQHYLMTQILDQVKFLKPNGYLFVLSSKKLFVPSLRDRLEPVLKELKTEAIFDLENVKGKGELGSYIYIFRKRQKYETELDRQLCSYFRISAELESFHQFSTITDHLRSFYLSHLTELPPLAQLEFPDCRIEYIHEAVVNGMLIHSANEDSSRITHPAFFKSLLDNCLTMDSLFEIKALTNDEKHSNREASLNLGLKKDISYFLVVDFRSSAVNLELHPMDTFRSIFSDYGQTQCSYFQLMPKFGGVNPNILRNYFLTPVGKQVTNLTFTGGPSLVKGSLSKFLVPKFLTQTEPLPDHLAKAFKSIDLSEEQLLDANPQTILTSFTHLEQATRDLYPRYACEILSRFSNLEHTLQSLTWKLDDQRYGQKVSFNNPLIQAQLFQKKTRAIYPENEDIYMEFVTVAADIHLPLTDTRIQISHEGELKLYSLELLSNERVIVRLHTEEAMALFINFILSQASGVPIAKILRAVHVPGLAELKAIIADTQSFKVSYVELLERVQKSIMEAFRLHVSSKRH